MTVSELVPWFSCRIGSDPHRPDPKGVRFAFSVPGTCLRSALWWPAPRRSCAAADFDRSAACDTDLRTCAMEGT